MAGRIVVPRAITDTDLYKITMGEAVFRLFPDTNVGYQFHNRGKTSFPIGFADSLRKSVEAMADLRCTREELNFLSRACPFLNAAYLDWFGNYRFNPGEVLIEQEGGDLRISIVGPMYRTIFWETPLMAVISQLYFEMIGLQPQPGWQKKAGEKGRRLREAGATFTDFGTRRRFSFAVQDEVINALVAMAIPAKDGGVFNGTSNVYLAMKYGLTPIGTVAHEWFMLHAALFGYESATCLALKNWAEVFQGRLGIALSDTFTTPVFLRDFDYFFTKLFDGIRQDSGDPFEILEMIINHYRELKVDPLTKTFVPSDNLDVDLYLRIFVQCRGRIKCSAGIGTNLTNNVGFKPLNMVIKLDSVVLKDGRIRRAVKLSDQPGKETGDPKEIAIAKNRLGIE